MGNIFSISLSIDPIITRCWDCATGQASYICNLKDNLHALQAKVAGLKELRSDLMSRVRIAEDEQQLKRLNQVEGWLSRAETLINDADQLIVQSPQHVENLCMGGCCSTHPRSSIKFEKQIAKKLQEVKDQKKNGDFSDVASKPPLPSATERPSEPTVGLESNFNKVWSCLQKEQVGISGIYGLGGVGKTTLLNQINNKFHDTTHDYHVIWAVASQDRPIERVQDQIAERIGLSNEGWKSKSLDEKAEDIFKPNMDNNIRVECLPPGEAFKLFEEKVGSETFRMHPDICKLAEAVVQECAGLPLALVTIARAMASKKTPREWEYAIEVLRQSAASVFPGVGKEMYPKLKFSYDCLPDERFRSCFLYCSLYPEDKSIHKDQLVDCWIGEGLLDEHTNLSSAKNQGHFVIGVQLKELPKAEKWEEVITDDFFNSMPMLRVLDLSDNVNLKELPVGIAKLVSLEHLNLSVTGIRKLPVELKTLAKLKYLNLEGTDDLEMIPQQLISNFSKLQVLKMEGCGYGCLLVLEEVEHLKHLNVLTITFRSASELEKASRFNKFFSCAIEVVSLEDFRDSRSL
ncbi:hypothetical protein GOBAR_DD34708 [Gossypium barbadense]|nr:hypothetical protein GOBAR_DD34708 [Gossypium barbadense]